MSTKSPKTILLCATRFWAGGGVIPRTTPTLRKGVRHVARKQGVTPAELDAAERALVKGGLLRKPGKGSVALTIKGLKIANRACRRVKLPPWNPQANFDKGSEGPFGMAKKKRKRKARLGMVLDRTRGTCRLNNADRAQWIDNDESLYNWKRRERGSMASFIKRNKAELDRIICERLL